MERKYKKEKNGGRGKGMAGSKVPRNSEDNNMNDIVSGFCIYWEVVQVEIFSALIRRCIYAYLHTSDI